MVMLSSVTNELTICLSRILLNIEQKECAFNEAVWNAKSTKTIKSLVPV